MSVEAMNCPNCGAGVAGDSTKCEFCRTRLKTMACPDCLGLMFVGTKHCGHCGKRIVAAAELYLAPAGGCPRCRAKLATLNIGEVELNECHKCSGLWMSVDAFEELCLDRDEQSAVLGFKPRVRSQDGLETGKISYVPCPVCTELMNRSNFARASGVIIDTCRSHGVWFDAEELPRIVEFIRNGGMRLARERESREIEEQRQKLRDDMRTNRLNERRFGPDRSYSEDEAGIKGFLRKLFN
jgi:Zn-finger nucleic acid-binding protein